MKCRLRMGLMQGIDIEETNARRHIRGQHFRCRPTALAFGRRALGRQGPWHGAKLVAVSLSQVRLAGNTLMMLHGSRQELAAMNQFV